MCRVHNEDIPGIIMGSGDWNELIYGFGEHTPAFFNVRGNYKYDS
jgi:hypothetical protein